MMKKKNNLLRLTNRHTGIQTDKTVEIDRQIDRQTVS